jgi:hypothetical protein
MNGRLTMLGLTGVLLGVTGCVSPQFEPAHGAVHTSGAGVAVGPFAPVNLRIHPLTHLERDSQGAVFLLAHIQLRDRWSDLCKGVGTVQLFLYKPTGLGGSGQEEQELRWEIDLFDLDQNAIFFDPATQTYRFSLGNLPGWVEQMVPGGDKTATGPGRFRVIARFTTPTPDGGQIVLVDELVVGR